MSGVDISLLAAPAVVEALDFEATLAAIKSDLITRYPAAAETLELESEPLLKLLEAFAYREIHLRGRINDAARAVMLAYAVGSDLDQIGANYDVARLPGEDDARLRGRIQQAYHLLAAAGPANAYRQHTLAVSADIIDVDVWSEAPGQVTVAVLGRVLRPRSELSDDELAAGTALFGPAPESDQSWAVAPGDGPLLRAVLAQLNAEDVRPLTDQVIVRAPTIRPFAITAVIEVYHGPDPELIRTRRAAALAAYLAAVRHLAYDVTRAGLIAALVEGGVKNVRLTTPANDIVCTHGEIAVCIGTTLTAEVVDA